MATSEAPGILLTASQPIAILVLTLIAVVVFSIWSYLKTNPPVPNSVRILLMVLRGAGLTGGILLIFQPLLKINRLETHQPQVLMFIDRSQSMGIVRNGLDNALELRNFFQSTSFTRFASRVSIAGYGFSDSVMAIQDFTNESDVPSGTRTDIGSALNYASKSSDERNPAMILLFSDGANNYGIDPVRVARKSKIPITTIGTGSAEVSFDLMVSDIAVNAVVYQGSVVPVEVSYRAIGAKDRQFEVILRDHDGKFIDKRLINVTDEYAESKLLFEVKIDSAGKFNYKVEIPAQNNELTTANNFRTVTINALANRVRILIVSGIPDYGMGDLVRRLSSNPHLDLTLRSTRGRGFHEGNVPDDELLAKMDLILLHHFPGAELPNTKLQEFATAIERSRLPVCYFEGGEIELGSLKLFEEFLPVTIGKQGKSIKIGRVNPSNRHAIIAPPDKADQTDLWNNLPPSAGRSETYLPKPNAETLANFTFTDGSTSPAIVISETAGRKSAAVLVRDIWKWGMLSPGEEGVVEPLLDRMVKWLTIRRSTKPVQLAFSSDQFNNRQAVTFRVTCFDESYQPFTGAEVTAEISTSIGDPILLSLTDTGNGQYTGSFMPWQDGEFTVKATAVSNGKAIGTDNGTITVEAYSIELLDTRLNSSLLTSIAESSGGRYIHLDSAAAFLDSLQIQPGISSVHRDIALWGGWLHLALVIAVLSLEWLIRMRLGML